MNTKELTIKKPLEQLSGALLAWYPANARDLPWRRTRDPYRIWVSEIMLQQTRVAAVLGYYARFLEAFPSVEALAQAPEQQLLKLWEGLGYYSRARNLQKAAIAVRDQYGGVFPADYGRLLALPGVGEYTAGAIASAAFGLRVPAVDGNVLRVVTRVTDDASDITDPKTKRAVRQALEGVMPPEGEACRIFNQAVMELGATVCVPNGAPKCEVCPAREFCLAHLRGAPETLPVKAARKERRIEEKTVFLLLRQGKLALRRRPDSGLLAGLWEYPNLPGTLDEAAAAQAVAAWGLTPVHWRQRLTAKHVFTHREWHMTGYLLEVDGEAGFLWADAAELETRAVPSAFARYTQAAREALEQEEGT